MKMDSPDTRDISDSMQIEIHEASITESIMKYF